MEKHTHSVHPNSNGTFTLKRDGIACLCPKTLVLVPVPNKLTGQIEPRPTQMPCSTSCPFATLAFEQKFGSHPTNSQASVDEGEKYLYRIKCEGRVEEIWLDDMPAENDKNKKEASKIVSL